MLDSIIKILALNLKYRLPFNTSFGLVSTQLLEKNGKVQKLPKADNLDQMTCDLEPEKFVFPSDSYNSLTFFKENRTDLKELFSGHYIEQRSNVTLGCWYNSEKLDTTLSNFVSTLILNTLIKIQDDNNIKNIEIRYLGSEAKNPYIGFDMLEEKNQYLMFPYVYFSLNFEIKFIHTWECVYPINVIEC